MGSAASSCVETVKNATKLDVIYVQVGGVHFPATKTGNSYNFLQPDFSGIRTPKSAFSNRGSSMYSNRNPYYDRDMTLLVPDKDLPRKSVLTATPFSGYIINPSDDDASSHTGSLRFELKPDIIEKAQKLESFADEASLNSRNNNNNSLLIKDAINFFLIVS